MAIEKKWEAVPSRQLTLNGGSEGQVTLASTSGFKVKQEVVLTSNSQPAISLEVKRVVSKTQLLVGKPGDIKDRLNISTYTVNDQAAIYAKEQARPKISEGDALRASFAEEPASALRSHLVDEVGRSFSDSNPVPVKLDSDSIQVTVVPDTTLTQTRNFFGEVPDVPKDQPTVIVTYIVPPDITGFLQRVEASGDNIGLFEVHINGVIQGKQRTHYMSPNVVFEFKGEPRGNGILVNPGDVVTVVASHIRDTPAAFFGRIQCLELG